MRIGASSREGQNWNTEPASAVLVLDGRTIAVPLVRFPVLKNTLFSTLLGLFLVAWTPLPGHGQLSLVAGAVHTKDLGGQTGVDARLGLDPPLMPVGVFVGADYFPARCDPGCKLWGYRAGAILHTSTPGIQPYISGAYLVRERRLGDETEKRFGMALGAGFRVTTGFRIQAEATWESLGGSLDHWVFRIGLGI